MQERAARNLVLDGISTPHGLKRQACDLAFLGDVFKRAGEMHRQHQRQLFWQRAPQLLFCVARDSVADGRDAFIDQICCRARVLLPNFIRETLEIVLDVEVQKPVNFTIGQATSAQSIQVRADRIVKVLRRLRHAIEVKPGGSEDVRRF